MITNNINLTFLYCYKWGFTPIVETLTTPWVHDQAIKKKYKEMIVLAISLETSHSILWNHIFYDNLFWDEIFCVYD